MGFLLGGFDAWVYAPSIIILQPPPNLRPHDPEEAVSVDMVRQSDE